MTTAPSIKPLVTPTADQGTAHEDPLRLIKKLLGDRRTTRA